MDTISRFSGKVELFAKSRPGYPNAIINILEKKIGFDEFKDVADVGSGTGILSKLFLRNGNIVFGVEPNDEMRAYAEKSLTGFLNFVSINGTAERLNLADESIDLLTAGQSFHWFNITKAKKEFKRVLNPEGCIMLVWNARKVDCSDFMRGYDKLFGRLGEELTKARAEHRNEKQIQKFFNTEKLELAKFDNFQILDFKGLKERLLSSTYIPAAGTIQKEIVKELKTLYDKFNIENKVMFEYETKVYYGKFK